MSVEVLEPNVNTEEKNSKISLLEKIRNNKFDFSIFLLSIVVAMIVLIMFFAAANLIKTGGLEIMNIESVGGKTLEEAYYQNLGFVYAGYCGAIKAIGIFCSSMLSLFGISKLKNIVIF